MAEEKHWVKDWDHRYGVLGCGVETEADEHEKVEWPWQVTCSGCIEYLKADGKAELLTEVGYWRRCVVKHVERARIWLATRANSPEAPNGPAPSGGREVKVRVFENGIILAEAEPAGILFARTLSLGPMLHDLEKLLTCMGSGSAGGDKT